MPPPSSGAALGRLEPHSSTPSTGAYDAFPTTGYLLPQPPPTAEGLFAARGHTPCSASSWMEFTCSSLLPLRNCGAPSEAERSASGSPPLPSPFTSDIRNTLSPSSRATTGCMYMGAHLSAVKPHAPAHGLHTAQLHASGGGRLVHMCVCRCSRVESHCPSPTSFWRLLVSL